MKNEMMVFEKEGFGKVRILEKDGNLWFVASDVSFILGFSEASAMTRNLDDDEKGLSNEQTLGGEQSVIIINESGLYSAILRSRKPEAKAFKKWITSEVIPSIRKTGSYSMKNAKKPAAQKTDQPIDMAPKTARAFRAYVSLMKTLGFDNNVAAISANQACMKLTGQNTLELLGQTHLDAEKQEQYFTPTELGKRINKNAREFNQLLLEKGLQEKVGDEWTPTDKGRNFCRMFDTGKKHGAGVSIVEVKWADSVVTALNKEKAA